MAEEILLTVEALKKRKQELEYLKTVKRAEIAERIERARAFGDLSENSEYDEAKNAQAFLEYEIAQLEERLRYARVVKEDEQEEGKVSIGSLVKVQELEDGEAVDEFELTICGDAEEDPANNKISYQAPIGKGLMGCEAGQVVDIEVPMGMLTLKVLEVSRA
ncbi:MAG: transcription elongation factor GreA [Clostridia bacterium]|nr:transcription elongation factor GreA [Clostridia bacterium]